MPALQPFGLSLSQPSFDVAAACRFSGRRPGVARRASNFLSRRRKKVTKERATPLSASPALCAGATCGARAWGALRNSLRACGAPLRQPQRVSPRSVCPSAHAAPRPTLLGAHRGDGGTDIHSGHCFARPRFAGAGASRSQAPLAPGAAHTGSSAATTRVAVRLFGSHPLLAAPAPGRLQGGSRASARLLRQLTRRGCPSGAAQQHSEFRGAPRNRTGAGLPRSEAKGSQTEGRLFFAYFLLAKQKKVSRSPGESRLPP